MYKRILVPIDGSATSSRGLREAIAVAGLTGARLRLLHMIDPVPLALGAGYAGPPAEVFEAQRRDGEALLESARREVEAAGVEVETALLDRPDGRLAEAVADEASQWPAELVVIGSHGRRGVGRALIGSDAEQVARTSPVPVLLVRGAG